MPDSSRRHQASYSATMAWQMVETVDLDSAPGRRKFFLSESGPEAGYRHRNGYARSATPLHGSQI